MPDSRAGRRLRLVTQSLTGDKKKTAQGTCALGRVWFVRAQNAIEAPTRKTRGGTIELGDPKFVVWLRLLLV